MRWQNRKCDKMKSMFKQIKKAIKSYDNIVIARHIGADPDALGSQMALKELININFPNKKVYTVGNPASRFKFMGSLDKMDNIDISKSLLFVLDTPDIKRIDGVDINKFDYVIKIDHHPFIEKFANIEIIDDNSCSTSQLILEFIFLSKLKINEKIARNLYTGIVSDTDRFLHDYTSNKTFYLVSRLLKEIDFKFTDIYNKLYERPFNEIKFEGYIYQNLSLTENGVAYIKINEDLMKEFGVDSASAGNMINNLKFVEGIFAWVFFSEDKKNNIIRANIRSQGPIINDLASRFGGGGHKYASGARLVTWDQADSLIEELDKLVKNYKGV